MLPLILAAVGGYLIGNSIDSKDKFKKGGRTKADDGGSTTALMQLFSYNYDTRKMKPILFEEFFADSEVGLFEQIEKANNRFRYSRSEYKFTDSNLEKRYNNWLKSDDYKSKGLDLFYGNGVVD